MEMPNLNSALWPGISAKTDSLDTREDNPKKKTKAPERVPLRGHKYKKEKFITLGDDPENQSVGIDEINRSIRPFREAVVEGDILAEASASLNILSAMERMGVENEDLEKLKEDLTLAKNKYLSGDKDAALVLRFRLGNPGEPKSDGEKNHMPSGKIRRASQPPGTATFLDLIYRTKYVPAGNSLGAVLYGLSKSKLRDKLATESIETLDLSQMPDSYRGAETRWVSKRSIKNAKKREELKATKAAAKEKRAAEKEAAKTAKADRAARKEAMQMTEAELAAALSRLRML